MKKMVIFFLFLWFPFLSSASSDLLFEEGKHFKRADLSITNHDLVQEARKTNPNKVQIVEFFSYGCHWCYKLDLFLAQWLKEQPAYIEFERILVAFQPSGQPHAKAFYSAQLLGQTEAIHPKLFAAVQAGRLVGKGPEQFSQFFEEEGILPKQFLDAYNSFGVHNKLTWANGMARAYKITAIPVIVVQGPTGTFFTGVNLAGSEEKLIEVITFLAEQAHAAILTNKKAN